MSNRSTRYNFTKDVEGKKAFEAKLARKLKSVSGGIGATTGRTRGGARFTVMQKL
jgi:hypothetical protein